MPDFLFLEPMLKRITIFYGDSFRGLSKEIWWLALVTFINRAGTMVLPFLTKYLKEDLEFTLNEVSWVMVCFGFGSVVGSWLGGKLSDKIGYYKVMVWSLLITGFLFVGLQYVTSFVDFCIALFVIMCIADTFRPAIFVSLKAYSKPENQTRSLTLIRLAINFGFVFGPSMAGLIIVTSGYSALFWIDGITCVIAILLFTNLVKEKALHGKRSDNGEDASILDTDAHVFKDKVYWIFLGVAFLMGMIFFQLFTTLPLYHKEQFNLTEFDTGMLFFLNGLVIVLLEMPMVHWIEQKKIAESKLILFSAVLMMLSFLILLYDAWAGMLVVSMIIITVGEMIGFPYTNAFAMKRAKAGNEGRYMALYTMAFSTAHIVSPKLGLDVIDMFGYQANFAMITGLGILAIILSIWLKRSVENEKIKAVV
ncbi:MFS transporter [Urechidicola sp. KH5]